MTDSEKARAHRFDVESTVMARTVPVAAVTPPGFAEADALPLIVSLHGGGSSREALLDTLPLFDQLFAAGALQPCVIVSFSSELLSWYAGAWERFVTDELPEWAHAQFGVRTDRDGVALTGGSMGGFGTLKIAFKHPERFRAIAAMEPAVDPSYAKLPDGGRNTFIRALAGNDAAEGAAWAADNPATIARDNADAIRASGLEIYLEVGDVDQLNLHDGAEFVHRVLWDHDIRHEYHLVRWADHVGASMGRRIVEAYRFLDAALSGGLEAPIDLPLTAEQQAYVDWAAGGGMRTDDAVPAHLENAMADPQVGPSVLAGMWAEVKAELDDPAMTRAYAELPPTK